MKKQILTPLILLGALALSTAMSSCKEKEKTVTPVAKQDEESESTSDANDTREETDAVFDESNQVMNDNKGKLGRLDASAVDTNSIGAKTITITGDSIITIVYENSISKDLRRTKSGQLIIRRIGTKKFHEQGGQFSVEYKDLKITRTIDQKKISINGTFNVTNYTGGHPWMAVLFTSEAPVTHHITGTVNVTLNDDGIRAWTVSRARTYDYLQVSVSEIAGTPYIEQGKNRRDNTFITTVPVAIVAQLNDGCGVGKEKAKVTSGKIVHTVTVGNIPTEVTAEFGYSGLNTMVTNDYCAVKGYQLTWKRVATFGPYFVQTYQ